MSNSQEKRGRGGKSRHTDEWRTVTERPEAKQERRDKQQQNRKKRREELNARMNVDQLTTSPGLSRNSGSSSVPVPFVALRGEPKSKRSRGGKRSRSKKQGVGAFDPFNPSGNFVYRQSPPGSRGRGRGGAPRGGRGGSGIYIHGHGYVGRNTDMDEVDLEKSLERISLDQESYSSSDDSDLDMEAVMDYIKNTQMQLADDSDEESHTGLGALDGLDNANSGEDSGDDETYVHLGLGAAPAPKRRRQNQKVADIVDRMEQGYTPAVEMEYRKKAKELVRDYRESAENVYIPQGSPLVPRAPIGGNSKERRRQKRDQEAIIQKYAARPWVRAQDPSSLLESDRTIIVSESSAPVTVNNPERQPVLSSIQSVQEINVVDDKVRGWWPRIEPFAAAPQSDQDHAQEAPKKPEEAEVVESVVLGDSIQPPQHQAQTQIEPLPDRAPEADLEPETSQQADTEAVAPVAAEESVEEESEESEAEIDGDVNQMSGSEEDVEEAPAKIATEAGSEEDEEGEESDEFDYDDMMEESSDDGDDDAMEGASDESSSEGSSSESESILIEFDSDSAEDSDDDDALASKKSKRRSLPGVPRWDEDNGDNDDVLSEEEEKLFKSILRGSFESEPTMLLATPQPRSFKERLALSKKQGVAAGIRQSGGFSSVPASAEKRLSKRQMKKAKLKKKKDQKRGFDHDGFTRAQLLDWNQVLREFIRDPALKSMPLSPMGRVRRYQMHQLCNYYRLASQSYGSGTKRYPSVSKTRQTTLPSEEAAEQYIEAFMFDDAEDDQESRPAKRGARFISAEARRSNGGSRGSGKMQRNKKRDHNGANKSQQQPANAATQPGRLVAQDADPIGEENKGFHLLVKMGWSGGGLGSQQQGIAAPIDATIKVNKRGLGFE